MAGADEAGQTPQVAEQTSQTSGQTPEQLPQTPEAPGFGERGRMRRRARFLRRARELAYRDLGGLVFDLHRFGQRNDQVVMAKLATLRQIDKELRALEQALRERRSVTVLREVGIAACPRCAAIHGSDDRFCPGCGLAFDANADRLISTAPVVNTQAPAQPAATQSSAQQTVAQSSAQPAATQSSAQPAVAQSSAQQTVAQSSAQPAVAQSAPARRATTQSAPAQPAPGQPGGTQSAPGQPAPAAAPEPTTSIIRPAVPGASPASRPISPPISPPAPVRPGASPFPARAASPEPDKGSPADEDDEQPTEILRPPSSGT